MTKIKAFNKLHLMELINKHIDQYGNYCDLNHIDISNLDDLSEVFKGSKFQGDISQWDTSNVVYMSSTFQESEFNGDISNWNTSKAINFNGLFLRSKFRGDLSLWDTSNVTKMMYCFFKCPYDGDLASWKINENCELIQSFSYIHLSPIYIYAVLKGDVQTPQFYSWKTHYEQAKQLADNLGLKNLQAARVIYRVVTESLNKQYLNYVNPEFEFSA